MTAPVVRLSSVGLSCHEARFTIVVCGKTIKNQHHH
jgi:hypothetical protein